MNLKILDDSEFSILSKSNKYTKIVKRRTKNKLSNHSNQRGKINPKTKIEALIQKKKILKMQSKVLNNWYLLNPNFDPINKLAKKTNVAFIASKTTQVKVVIPEPR